MRLISTNDCDGGSGALRSMVELMKGLAEIISGLTGLVLLVKAVLDVLREYQTNKAAVGTLLVRRSVRIAIGLILLLFPVLVATVWRETTYFAITAQLWDIKLDEKNAVVASRQFSGFGSKPSNGMLQQIGGWVTNEIGKRYDLSAESVKVHVSVPADLSTGKVDIQATPPGPLDVNFWLVGEGGKLRAPLDPAVLAGLDKNFQIEISRPGYEVHIIPVTWHEASDSSFALDPHVVSIGIEEFSGDKYALASRLSNYLVANTRFAIKDPNTLKVLRAKIAEEKQPVASQPMVQTSLRSTLGLDLIITGTFKHQ